MGFTTKGKKKGKFVFVLFAILLGVGLLIAFLQFLWNTLVTDIFGLRAIGYWEALGLFILSRILFGHGFGKQKRGVRKRSENEKELSEQDREKLKSEWRRRFEERFKC
ncbi:hypothetical protein [Sphingobacterium deserti]|uniref:Uncharacterized protein n=1 Tax=Sphingobacterium deserti TaxID=1229276 RepID=A0A0B8SZL8_9SPHI|nr:hypothetical protein [Sphingobacterium deserti]KGE13031.1 hypothetical protein DI53_3248 [Sphingobacterium deserti]